MKAGLTKEEKWTKGERRNRVCNANEIRPEWLLSHFLRVVRVNDSQST